MADFPKVDRLKSQLITSQISRNDPVLFQVINTLIDYVRQGNQVTTGLISSGGSGGGSAGITALSGDVVATGPGAVVATIQPLVVDNGKIADDAVTTLKVLDSNITYAKIQNTALADILLGRALTPGQIQEIQLGANLQIVGDTLQVIGPGGSVGLEHNLLSATHPDTIPDSPIVGDLIYATEGSSLGGTYYGFIMNALVVEDFVGIRAGYEGGYHGNLIPGNCQAYGPPDLDFIPVVPPNSFLSWDDVDGYLLSLLVEDFIGFRAGYTFTNFPVPSNYAAYYPPELAFIAPPSPTPAPSDAIWTRTGIGAEGQILTVTSGIPTWETLVIPTPPTPEYPWQDIPFSAGDFTAFGGSTPDWTVAAGDVARWQYQQFPGVGGIGNNVRVCGYFKTTSVSGSAPTRLDITIPFNIIGEFAQFISIRENTTAITNTYIYYNAAISANHFYFEKIGGTAFDTTADETYISFEISAVLAP